MGEQSLTKPPPRGRRRRVLLLVGIPFLVLLALWFGVGPDVPTKPLHFTRDKTGKLVAPGGIGSGFNFTASWTTCNSQTSLCSTSHSALAGAAPFLPCRRIAVFNRSKHLLLQRVGPLLAEYFEPLNTLQALDYYPDGTAPAEGESAPDLIMTLTPVSIKDRDWLVTDGLVADISVTLGRRWADSSTSVQDSNSPPVVDFAWSGRIRYNATTRGLRSGSSRLENPAKEIAAQIGKALAKDLGALLEKHGPQPALPQSLFPAYRPAPALPEPLHARRLYGFHGFMTYNESAWRFNADSDAATVLPAIQKTMSAAGWKTTSISHKGNIFPDLRMMRQSALLEIFPAGDKFRFEDTGAPDGIRSQPQPPSPRESEYCILYTDPMSPGETQAAVQELFAQDAPFETLALFQPLWTPAQRKAALQKLKDRPPRNFSTWLALARMHHQSNDKAAALDALERAKALALTTPGDVEKSARQVAKDMGEEKNFDRPPAPAVLKELGFIELEPHSGQNPKPIEINLDEPAVFYTSAADGGFHVVTIRPLRAANAGYDLGYVVNDNAGMRCWGTAGSFPEGGSTNYADTMCKDCQGTFTLSKPADSPRFRLTVQIISSVTP